MAKKSIVLWLAASVNKSLQNTEILNTDTNALNFPWYYEPF